MAEQLDGTVVELLTELIDTVRNDVAYVRGDLREIDARITRIENGFLNGKRSGRVRELGRVGAFPAAVVTLIEVGRYIFEIVKG